MKQCQVDTCKRRYFAKGYCKLHYDHKRKYGKTFEKPLNERHDSCEVPGCGRSNHAKGLCQRHWQQIKIHGKIIGNTKRSNRELNECRITGDICVMDLYNLRGEKINETIFDAEDICLISDYKWGISSQGYAVYNGGEIGLASLIMGFRGNRNRVIDHLNRNKLDNRKSNLKVCSKSENAVNAKIRKDNTSGIKGVSWDKKREKWQVHMSVGKKVKSFGRFLKKEDAIAILQNAILKHHGRDG